MLEIYFFGFGVLDLFILFMNFFIVFFYVLKFICFFIIFCNCYFIIIIFVVKENVCIMYKGILFVVYYFEI